LTLQNDLITTDSTNFRLKKYAASLSCFYAYLFRTIIFVSLLSVIPVKALSADEKKTANTNKSVESQIQYSGVLYKSGNRRDPFLALPKKTKTDADEEISRGLPPPGIAGTFIAQITLEGTSIREDRKTAIVRGRDNRSYFLREGDRLFDGYLKTIQEDSIILIRETKMSSGKTMTQEVTKRLRIR
jgi:hypothetical protein